MKQGLLRAMLLGFVLLGTFRPADVTTAQAPLEIVRVGEIDGLYEGEFGVTAVLLSPVDERIAYVADAGTLVVYDLTDRVVERAFAAEALPTGLLAWSPDGRWIGAEYADGVRVWDVASGDLVKHLHGVALFYQGDFSPDGTLLAVQIGTDGIVVYDLEQDGIRFSLSPSSAEPRYLWRVAFQPGGTLLALRYEDSIDLWDIAQHDLVAMLDLPENPLASRIITFSPDGRRFAMGFVADLGQVSVWDSQTYALQWTYTAPLSPVTLTWTANSDQLVALFNSMLLVSEPWYHGDAVAVLDAATGTLHTRLAFKSQVDLFIEPNADEVLFNTVFDVGFIAVINLRTGAITVPAEAAGAHTFTVTEHYISASALSRDETAIVTTTADGLVLWDVATGSQIAATSSDVENPWVAHVLMAADYILTVPGSAAGDEPASIGLWQVGPA